MIGPAWLPLVLTLLAAAAYTFAVLRLRGRGDRWPWSRTAYFFVGDAILTVALLLLPPLVDPPSFPLHVVQHLMLAMAAPLALALSAPFTLALRALPPRPRSVLLSILHSRLARVVMCAPVILVVDIGGTYAYYLTGLFSLTEESSWLHMAMHAHMFLAGCLLSWYLVARDPIRNRPSTVKAIIVLFIASGNHDLLAKLMYAHDLSQGEGTTAQLQLGSQIMFCGGDLFDLLLVATILANWYLRTGRELARHERRHNGNAATGSFLPHRDVNRSSQATGRRS